VGRLRANVRFASHRWKIGKPGEGDSDEDIAPVLRPDEPVPEKPVFPD